jgi:hypothetical protein
VFKQEGGNVVALYVIRNHHQSDPMLTTQFLFQYVTRTALERLEARTGFVEGVGVFVMLSVPHARGESKLLAMTEPVLHRLLL